MKYLAFLFAYLASVFISRKHKVPYIIIAFSVSILVVSTGYIWVNHLLNIKFANLNVEMWVWHERHKLIYPEEC